jgi:phosphopantothenoylcysteine decarboxylase
MNGRELVVGVTGGVACFKTAALVSQLAKAGANVTVVMSPAAEKFVGAATFAALSGRGVVTDIFDPRYPLGAHIELAEKAELLCIAPATADFLAKAANGFADDVLSTLYLAFSKPVLMAPAMNTAMWNQPAVQRNVARLVEDGVQMIGPGSGWLSCRQVGSGRMSEAEELFSAIKPRLE